MVSDAVMATSSSTSQTPINVFSPSAPTPLSHAHHFISIKLTSTNYLFWKTQLSLSPRSKFIRICWWFFSVSTIPYHHSRKRYSWNWFPSCPMGPTWSTYIEFAYIFSFGRDLTNCYWFRYLQTSLGCSRKSSFFPLQYSDSQSPYVPSKSQTRRSSRHPISSKG